MGLEGIEVVMMIEEEFGVSLDSQETSRVKTVGELIDLVQRTVPRKDASCEDIALRVREIVAYEVNMPLETIQPHLRFRKDLNF